MNRIWERIESWLIPNAPQVYNGLKSGATDTEISQAEAFFGIQFPDDLRSFYAIHNGQEDDSYLLFPHLEFLSLQAMVEISETWMESNDPDFQCDPINHSQKIWNGWWHPLWIPFTLESNGACYCVDLAPTTMGSVGQVILVEWNEPFRELVSPSFKDYMEAFTTALEQGEYRFSENAGGLVDDADYEMFETET